MQDRPARSALASLLLLFGTQCPAPAQCGTSFVEGFTNFSNVGNWVWPGLFQAGLSSGGNPHFRLYSEVLSVERPTLRTTLPAEFGGDYRAREVTSLGVDLRTDLAPDDVLSRRLALRLETDSGTPSDPTDDLFVEVLSGRLPARGGPWVSYLVDVPSDSPVLPPGWRSDPSSPLTPDATWNAVVQSVTRVSWILGDPQVSYPVDLWRLSADNPRIALADGPSSYCSAEPASPGCSPSLEYSGIPTVTPGFFFGIAAEELVNQQTAVFFYGFEPTVAAFGGGLRCVGGMLRRRPPQATGGNPPPLDCSGSAFFNLNAFLQTGTDPQLVAGATLYVQCWSRDPGASDGIRLTNAVRVTICP